MSKNNGANNSSIQSCLINLYFKLKGKIEMESCEDEADFVNSNEVYSASPEEITQRILKMVVKCFSHYEPEIQQSNLENSLSQNSKGELATEYEAMIQKLEAEVRSHIRLEQQLKLHADSLQAKVEENEKLESSNKQMIQRLNDEICQIKSENKIMQSELSKFKDYKNHKDYKDHKDHKGQNNGLEKKIILNSHSNSNLNSNSNQEKINHLKGKKEKTKTRVDAINISELSNKTQAIINPTKRSTLFESKQIDQEEIFQNQNQIKNYNKNKNNENRSSSKNNLENNNNNNQNIKLIENKISITSNDIASNGIVSKETAKQKNFMMCKTQSNFPKRNLPDQKSVLLQLGIQRKRNSEIIRNDMKVATLTMQKSKGSLINSNNAFKRIINNKTKNCDVYKTINHILEPKEIQTERRRGIPKESVEKNNNSVLKDKLKKLQKFIKFQ